MEGAVIFGFGLFALGLFFAWTASRLWKFRDGGSVSVLEATILKAADEEPLPLTSTDRWLHYFQFVMASLFAAFLIGVSIYGLLEEAGAL